MLRTNAQTKFWFTCEPEELQLRRVEPENVHILAAPPPAFFNKALTELIAWLSVDVCA
jgi:hypothetical protein